MKIAILKGNRMNPWHMAVFAPAARVHELRAFVLSGNLFELDSVGLAMERIFWKNEMGSFVSRKMENLKYRLLHPRTGYEIPVASFHERLEGYDAVHTWELHTDWSLEASKARRKYGVPLVVQAWETIPFAGGRPEVRSAVMGAADRFAVYTDRSEKALLLEGADRKAIRRLRPGVDLARFTPAVPPAFAPAEDAVRAGRPVVLFAGRLIESKGVHYLLWAFKLVLDAWRGPRPLLVIVGQGAGKATFQQISARLALGDDVRFEAPVPYEAIPGLYRSATVLVLPSLPMPAWQEQFGMVLIEAMASGVPVISTLSGAIPEIVGRAGILVPPADVVELSRAMLSLLGDEPRRSDLSHAGRRRAEERFDAAKNGELIRALYEELR